MGNNIWTDTLTVNKSATIAALTIVKSDGSAGTIGSTGNVNIGGDLTVDGTMYVDTTVSREQFSGSANFAHDVEVVGGLFADSTLGVSGSSKVAGVADFSSPVFAASTLGVSGSLKVAGVVDLSSPVFAASTLGVSGSAVVSGSLSSNQNTMLTNVLTGTGLVAIPFAGFFQIPVAGAAGAGLFTGSLPAPASFPGGHLLLTDTMGNYAWKLTGTVSMMSGSTLVAPGKEQSVNGSSLSLSAGATVGLWSDAKGWLVCALSGTAVVA